MKKKAILLAVILLIAAALTICITCANAPEYRAAQFVRNNGADFSALVALGQPIPETFAQTPCDIWSGEHISYEFRLGTGVGERQYWGVYYSPDAVPLAFQNADVALSAIDEAAWTWSDGNNHGTTKKITDQWYYFEASF